MNLSVTNSVFYRAGIYGAIGLLGLVLTACGGGGGGATATPSYTVSASASTGGSISPDSVTVNNGATTDFTVTTDTGYSIASVSGCGGSLAGNTYTTGAVMADCTVTAEFLLLPPAPMLLLTPQSIKTFSFSWTDVTGETEYRLLENPDGVSGYTQVASIAADAVSHDLVVSLPARINASYILQACNSGACSDSSEVFVSGTLAEAVGYVKASNSRADDSFGYKVALSADGNTLAISALFEDGGATGIDGNQVVDCDAASPINCASDSGAVYLFTRGTSGWAQQAYIKASNTGAGDWFGDAMALSADGTTLAVGARTEDSNATGICAPDDAGCDALQNDNSAGNSGAVYLFAHDSATGWGQQAYIKASNAGVNDNFGGSVALSADGSTLAVGAYLEDSAATGIDGNQVNDCGAVSPTNCAALSGAAYLFTRGSTGWAQQTYIKASNTGAVDRFGYSVALSADGTTLVVGANQEDGNATGIGGNETDNSAANSGAAYLFTHDSTAGWAQQAYVKASNAGAGDAFGSSVALSADGTILAVGAYLEDSAATGIDGNEVIDCKTWTNCAPFSGAVYLFAHDSTSGWVQQAYIKASNTGASDYFGSSLALSGDGATLAVGAYAEESAATGINGDESDDTAIVSGAVYLFNRDSTAGWSQQAYIKAPNTGVKDFFGADVAVTTDGSTLAIGAYGEDSNATGIGGDQADNTAAYSGAVYLY